MRNQFLEEFAQLCEKYEAKFYYTTDDDGIHISIGSEDDLECEDVYVGHGVGTGRAAESLRDAKHKG